MEARTAPPLPTCGDDLDPPYDGAMAVLGDAALDERERELVDRFVSALEWQYGNDLDAVWLYGLARAASVRTPSPTSTCSSSRGANATTSR